MLRALRLDSRFGGVSARAWVDRLARPMALGLAAALLARVRPVGGLAPFALAFLAAALVLGEHPLAPVLGCLTGALGADGFQTGTAAGAGAVLVGFLGWDLSRRWVQRRRGRESPEGSPFGSESGRTARDAAGAVLACVGILVPGVPLAAGGPWESLRTALTAVAAAACTPFLRALIEVRPARRHLMPEERTGLMIFLLAGLAGLTSMWIPAGWTAAFFGVLICAPLGAGAGACAGLGAGGALMLAGGGEICLPVLGLCGLMAGLAPSRQYWVKPVVMVASALAAMPLLGAPVEAVICAAVAAGLSFAVPESGAQRARTWLSGETQGACDPDRLAARLRGETERRLRALSGAFGELAEGYRLPVDVPDEQTLIADMRDCLCENCPGYAECWVGGDNRAVRFLCQLISEAIDWSHGDCAEPLFGEEMPPDVLRLCRRGRSIPSRLGLLLEEFARKRRSEMKRGAMNQLISAQFMQAQMLLCGLADQQARPVRIRGRQAARARAALDREGIEAREVMALRGTRMEIVATLKCGAWTPELSVRAAGQLSRVFGRVYAPDPLPGVEKEMKFVRLPRLRATAASSCHSRQAGVPSGDSHIIRMMEGDRLLMMISDGMGSGEAAARESAQTLRLLWQFLAADVSRTLALETVNELMLARSDSDMFATVDLCLIDLSTGEAEFTKLAACRSLIVRNGEVITVEGGRLPLGILEKVQPSVSRVRLEPGDVVLMASDGVMDAVASEEIRDALLACAHRPPEEIAERILAAAERAVDGERRDDMTALCARVGVRRDPVGGGFAA